MSIWIENFIQKNEFSRPAIKLLGVKGIVMHWTADANASDENEHDFFDGKDGGGGRYASAHFFIDRDSATLIIPVGDAEDIGEVAYHANEHPCKVDKLKATVDYYPNGGANLTSIGVEMCVEKDSTIHDDTVSRAIDVVVELCKKFKLDPLNDIYRHFDITGKNCPAPWVTDEQKFIDFKKNVNSKLNPIVKVENKVNPAPHVAKPQPKAEPKPQPKAESKPQPKPQKKYIVLPSDADSWAVYPLNEAPVKANAKGYLNPKKFHGLTYEVLGNPQKDVYTIQTNNFGKVNIYGATSTGAKIITK